MPYPSLAQLQFFLFWWENVKCDNWSVRHICGSVQVCACRGLHVHASVIIHFFFIRLNEYLFQNTFALYCMSPADILRAESHRHGNREPEGCFLAICTQVTSRMWQQSLLIKASKYDCSLYTSFSFPWPGFGLVLHRLHTDSTKLPARLQFYIMLCGALLFIVRFRRETHPSDVSCPLKPAWDLKRKTLSQIQPFSRHFLETY